jgi:hypothetical protein
VKANHVVLSMRDQERIDTLAAHFVMGSAELMGLANAISDTVRLYIAMDRNRLEYEKAVRP